MPKKRHQKDRLYLIPSEYAESWGGFKADKQRLPFRCLPFYCCALTLLPFKDPVCTEDGIVFERAAILTWLTQYSQNPVDGKPLSRKDLIPLHFHKNTAGEFHCPVTFKVFNEHTGIVANRKSGHVYSKDAIDELCRKGGVWLDLITSEKFSPKDLITIQDPSHPQTRMVESFHFIRNDVTVEGLETWATSKGDERSTARVTPLIRETLSYLKDTESDRVQKHAELKLDAEAVASPPEQTTDGPPTKKIRYSKVYTVKTDAASVTSTVVAKGAAGRGTQFRELTDEEVRREIYAMVKAKKFKSYVKLITNYGALNLELRSDLVPETVHNFLLHCQMGSYDRTVFHRLIPKFMIQGGDPTGTGKGGICAFHGKDTFRDEFHPHLRHDKRGVVSMANSGIDSNKSQFFITFAPSPHLDDLHTIFGQVVGGLDVLDKLELVPTNPKTSCPLDANDVKTEKADLGALSTSRIYPVPSILSVQIFKNPYPEAETLVDQAEEKRAAEAKEQAERDLKPHGEVESKYTKKMRQQVEADAREQKRNAEREASSSFIDSLLRS